MPSLKVVDSWAMVAWVQDEPAADAFEAILLAANAGQVELLMSWYNVAETFYTLAKRNSPYVAEEFLRRLPSLPIRVVLPDENGNMAAARVKAFNAVAFGDAFAIVLAMANGGRVITGDAEIRKCGAAAVDWIGA